MFKQKGAWAMSNNNNYGKESYKRKEGRFSCGYYLDKFEEETKKSLINNKVNLACENTHLV